MMPAYKIYGVFAEHLFEKYLKGAASYAPLFSPDTRHIIIVKFQ